MKTGNGTTETWGKWQESMLNEGFANARRLARLPFLYERAQRVKKGATPSEIVYEEDRLRLFHYLSDQPARYKTPLVFVFALVNRPYILDLKAGRSVSRRARHRRRSFTR